MPGAPCLFCALAQTDPAALAAAQLHHTPPNPRLFTPAVDDAVVQILDAMLDKRPERRPVLGGLVAWLDELDQPKTDDRGHRVAAFVNRTGGASRGQLQLIEIGRHVVIEDEALGHRGRFGERGRGQIEAHDQQPADHRQPQCGRQGLGAGQVPECPPAGRVVGGDAVSYTHLRAHETVLALVCRLLLDKKKI